MTLDGYVINDAGKPVDRFTLEEKIMAAWHTADDIEALYRSLDGMDKDQTMNAVLGLHIFAKMRFDELWDTFEALVHNERFENKIETHLP